MNEIVMRTLAADRSREMVAEAERARLARLARASSVPAARLGAASKPRRTSRRLGLGTLFARLTA
jgi:hypothetical protein